MSNTKHTPGPWHYDPHYLTVQVDSTWMDDDNDKPVKCIIARVNEDANARLIAAAPELLEALQDMVSDHECLSKPTIDFARRAIAKATQP